MKLELLEYVHEHLPRGFTPYYIYAIMVDSIEVGRLIFREGTMQQHYFDGHIGYHIDEAYRGHHYAIRLVCFYKNNYSFIR